MALGALCFLRCDVCVYIYVCVCVYVCVCIYIYIYMLYVNLIFFALKKSAPASYIHIHTYIHTYIHTHIHTDKERSGARQASCLVVLDDTQDAIQVNIVNCVALPSGGSKYTYIHTYVYTYIRMHTNINIVDCVALPSGGSKYTCMFLSHTHTLSLSLSSPFTTPNIRIYIRTQSKPAPFKRVRVNFDHDTF